MTSFLLDTNALSEVSKREPDQSFMDWFAEVDEHVLYTSCLVLGEIKKDIALCDDAIKQERYSAALAEIIQGFASRIVEVDTASAMLWGELIAS